MPLTTEEKKQVSERLEKHGGAAKYQGLVGHGPIYTPVTWSASEEQVNEAWGPLASVLEKCKNITYLAWDCENQFPPCLLEAIKRKHPDCRLQILLFRLHSLTDSGMVDDYERGLLESSNLHSISVRPFPQGLNDKHDYNVDAFYQVLNAAPNLKHVIMIPAVQSKETDHLSAKKEWKGFQPPLRNLEGRTLSSLMLLYGDQQDLELEDLLKWSRSTDLSKIRFLTLEGVTDSQVFTHLNETVNLKSLKMLDIDLRPKFGETTSLVAEAKSLLDHLNPLNDVRLSGCLTSSLLETVFQKHGQTLHNMSLRPLRYEEASQMEGVIRYLTPKEIREIESSCPLLENLEILTRLKRSFLNYSWKLSDICPNLPHLQGLILHADTPLSTPSEREESSSSLKVSPQFERMVKHLWVVIRKMKQGTPLSPLHVMIPYVNRSNSLYIQSS